MKLLDSVTCNNNFQGDQTYNMLIACKQVKIIFMYHFCQYIYVYVTSSETLLEKLREEVY